MGALQRRDVLLSHSDLGSWDFYIAVMPLPCRRNHAALTSPHEQSHSVNRTGPDGRGEYAAADSARLPGDAWTASDLEAGSTTMGPGRVDMRSAAQGAG